MNMVDFNIKYFNMYLYSRFSRNKDFEETRSLNTKFLKTKQDKWLKVSTQGVEYLFYVPTEAFCSFYRRIKS